MVSSKNRLFYDVFDKVWDRYKRYSGVELSAMTHEEGSPWWKARQAGRAYVDDDDIERYFRKLAGKKKGA